MTVDGVGTLGLPIAAAQAEALVAMATPAPYGRGPDTIIDPNVRRCGQIPANNVHVDDPRWARTLEAVVSHAAAALGVEGAVHAELYKLLVYQPGDFFTEHRDTEKAPGMFATLVVVLPSEHAGGELVIRHDGREAMLDLADGDLGVVRWAAFYADCQHELRPLRVGHRVALIYNLVRPNGRAPRVPDVRPDVARVAKALRSWGSDTESPVKLVYPLKHQYSLAELSFGALKNEDAAAADVLTIAADEAGCVLRLAMVSIEESGTAEPIWDGHRSSRGGSYRRDDEDEGEENESYEVTEVHDRSQVLDGWRRPDDSLEPLGPIPYEDTEVSPAGALADEEPDEDHFHEASGNEGCSFERTYRRAALVLWPGARELEFLHQGGPEASVAVLERLLDEDPSRAAAMAALVVAGWERPGSCDRGHGELRARLIKDLARLPDIGALRQFLWDVVTAGSFDGAETSAVVATMARFESPVVGELLARLATSCAVQRFAPVARLLLEAGEARPGPTLARAVTAAVAAMPRIGDSASEWADTGSAMRSRAAGLTDLVRAVGTCREPSIAVALVAAALENPGRWPMDAVVVPAAVALDSTGNRAYTLASRGLRNAALAHLRARMQLPLAAPPDATRSANGMSCICRDCISFRAFLAHPSERTWSLKAAKATRAMVQSHIQAASCDVECRTDTRGNPHTLICTKNQASYEAGVKQRGADTSAVARLQ